MKTKELCIHGLLIALVAVCTMVFQIPVSATQGYVHLGDSMILLVGVFFGARYGMVAGGIGSALADVLSGYSHWAPFTLIIKGLMGWLIGKIASGAGSRAKFYTGRNLLAAFVGVAWMVFGYYRRRYFEEQLCGSGNLYSRKHCTGRSRCSDFLCGRRSVPQGEYL